MDDCTKLEQSQETKHELSMAKSELVEIKCIKRRRRSPSAVAPRHKDQQQRTFQVDQATAGVITNATASTVKRSSRFRGVSRHRWTGRFEAHLWDKGSWNATQKKKGKQVYLGAYDEEEAAARAYDLAAIKYWGTSTYINFPISDYEKEIDIMQNVTREEYLASLRRRSSGFARGVSKYRGVARHHHNGRWEARIGRVFGNKYLYLGTYSTQEEAAHAYDIAAIEYRGINAVTNFDLSNYIRWLRSDEPNLSQINGSKPENETSQSNSVYVNPLKDYDFLNNSSFAINNQAIPQKHEIIERKMPLGPCGKTSGPTALGILLKSSMFKQLVEKTSSVVDEDTEAKRRNHRQETGSEEDEFVFFTGNNADACAPLSDMEKLPRLKAVENEVHPHPMWNVVQY